MTLRRIQPRRTKGWRKPPGAVSSPAPPAGATPTAWPSTARPAPPPSTAGTSRSIPGWPTPPAASSPGRFRACIEVCGEGMDIIAACREAAAYRGAAKIAGYHNRGHR